MVNVIKRAIGAAVLGAMMLGAAGCIRDDIGKTGPDGPVAGQTRVEFTLDFPQDMTTAATRATDEEAIADLNVLIFEVGNSALFVERIEVPVTALDQSGDYKAFTIDFEPTDAQTKYGFLVYANADAELDALDDSYYSTDEPKTPDLFLAALTFAIPDGGLDCLPMMGASETAEAIASTTKIPTIQMLRAVARIDLEISSNLADKLRFGDEGVVAPYSYAENMISWKTDIFPSRSSSKPHIETSKTLRTDPLTYATTEGDSSAAIYIGEYDNTVADNEFALVMNAEYGVSGDSRNCWYKVLVRDKQGNKLDILRNHRYVITITGVTGPGADSWEEAMVGPAYVQATVTPWNNAEQNVLFDGTNLMIVQEKDFTIYREAGSTQIDAGAFIADGGNANGLKWSLDTGDATSSDIWATVTSQTSQYVTDAVEQMGAEGTVYNLTLNIAWAENAELDYDATLTFKAGNMSYVVKIHHSTDSWITFDTESYYLLDGKFHEMGVTASDEWSLISTYDGGINNYRYATFVSGDDLVSDFTPVSYGNVADKVIFSTTECDPAVYEDGIIRLTFHNNERNYADKTVDIRLTSGTADGGILAPPGVIGYIKGTNTLTLRGSKEYEAIPAIATYAETIDPLGLEDETVYVAYFKFGSLVALSSDPSDENTPYLEWNDIIRGPEEWSGGLAALKANPTWVGIPHYNGDASDPASDYSLDILDISAGGYNTQENKALGKGDPCRYYFPEGGWVTPSGNPYNGYSAANFGEWIAANGDIPAGRFGASAGEFYPAAGNRDYVNNGMIEEQGTQGNYWSSIATDDNEVYGLGFTDSSVYFEGYITNNAYGFAVRCIKPVPTIEVTPTSATFVAAGETKTFTVTTTNIEDKLSVTSLIDNSTGTTTDWVTKASISSSSSPYTLTVTVATNNGVADRAATITLTAGTVTATVAITQAAVADNTPSDIVSTVGAFWRGDETGERIVTIPTTTSGTGGAWTAQVVYYGTGFSAGDILMVEGNSEDATSIAANTWTDPEEHQADDYPTAAQTISSTATAGAGNSIKFRIFMKEEWDGANPRYAKIAVNFGSTGQYTRYIYIRQGEQADYLMTRNDAGTNVTAANGFTRPYAAKFSPYNLTTPEFNGEGSQNQRGASTAARSGVMTDYPSQAGAFYKWAEDAGVVAYNPAVPGSAAVESWVSSNNVTAWWDATGGQYEGCPSGYRRPTYGSTSKAAMIGIGSNTEFAQSIYSNPPTGTGSYLGNSVWGYYSDGWFDRFTPGQQTANSSYAGTDKTAVSTDNSTVAYVGRLFYNPVATSANYNASLFFPAPGHRYASTGYLYLPGTYGYYWSSSGGSGSEGVYLVIQTSATTQGNNSRHHGISVRCVVAE